ncbi:hypothetical protein AB0F72_38735 [Actinoplanes sp. NPDC023936]|uniref:WXG100 family type VII secretion target n=1 Tax=Actinoplanes sp. NPDC023936 TaxID=3154910 RepID=UPI0034034CC2
MDGTVFHVDLATIDEAASAIARTVAEQDQSGLHELQSSAAHHGDDELAGAFRDYCGRWSDGLDLLTEDARLISDALSRAASAYRAVDEASARTLTVDPALEAMDE